METLFSFELLVDSIRMDMKTKVSDELAVALRLLDFPTLIIYQPEHKIKGKEQGEFPFNKGKACFFKLNMDLLHSHLSNTPLYAMVLDVKEEIPKFVGSSLISLAKLMNKIRLDVTERGFSTPSSHGQRGIVSISNLTGEKVGTISLSYKLLSLGSSLISQINTSEVQCLKDVISKKEVHKKPVDSENIHSSKVDQDGESRRPQSEACGSTCQVTSNSYEEDTSVFCPPQLYYNNSAEENQKYKEESHKLKKIDLGAFAFEDSEDEGDTNVHSSVKEQSHNAKHLSQEKQQVSSEVTPNVIGEALRQMPLLNALLVELSQLNTVNTNQSMSVHPNLAWIHRPASTEQIGQTNTLRHRHVASPNLNFPRHCSTPVQEETHRKNTPRKKLVYGTTKTYNLRLKRNSPAVGQHRECVGLIQSKMQLKANKEKTKSTEKVAKSAKRKSTQISNLTENIETMIQSITVESTPQELKNVDVCKSVGMLHEDRASLQENPLLIKNPLRHAQIPADVESDISLNNSEKINQSHTDGQGRKSSGSSSRSSPDSSVSDHSGEGNEEVDDYADDFTSFEQSEAYSPDPMSSPEPRSRAKTPNSLGPDLCQSSESSSGSVQISRAVLPIPVKASRSPQRVLRGTYTIQHQTYASGVSFSSEGGDRDGVTSGLTGHLEKQLTWSSSRSSGESLRSSGGHRTNSKRGLSNESSLEHRAEEEDELGTLDFRKGYKHISELVAQKLPGYTM